MSALMVLRRTLLLLTLIVFALPTQAFENPELAQQAQGYRQAITSKTKGGANLPAASTARAKATTDLDAGRREQAVAGFEQAIAQGLDETAVWLSLSQAWTLPPNPDRAKGMQAAYAALGKATTGIDRAAALFRIGALAEESDKPLIAIAAFEAGLKDNKVPKYARRHARLVQRFSLALKDVRLDFSRPAPRVCLEFSERLATGRTVKLEDYVKLAPNAPGPVAPQGQSLCVGGVDWGKTYDIEVLAGLPAASGAKLSATQKHKITVTDQTPALSFKSRGFILPREGDRDIALSSVNLERAYLKLYRVNDRNLVSQIGRGLFEMFFSLDNAETIRDQTGEQVWSGSIAIKSQRNQQVTTAVALGEIVKDPAPGVYVLTASKSSKSDDYEERYEDLAVQWIVVSDLGLTTFTGNDGIDVFVRGLNSAKPVADVEVTLYARNNSELGKARSGAQGRVHFARGLARGTGGNAPIAVMAYGNGDFAFHNLQRPAFDLSDRGVSGRMPPGPVDVFLYTERGIYRPGEIVQLAGLARDEAGVAVDGLTLTLKLIRPDGGEYSRQTARPAQLGGMTWPIQLSDSAQQGSWRVEALLDPAQPPVGRVEFVVDDFVPERLKVVAENAPASLRAGELKTLDLSVDFLYGAPGAGLTGEAEALVELDETPYPMHPGYRFGLVQERFAGKREQLEFPTTDARGKAKLPLRLTEVPETSKPLKANLQIAVFEPGGRATRIATAIPVATQPVAIGIKPKFSSGSVAEGEDAGFEVITVERDGKMVAAANLGWELYREEYYYQWYQRGGRWRYEWVLRDSVLQSGRLGVDGKTPAALTQSIGDWGRYRLEITDPATGAATSYRFFAGWTISPEAANSPDKLEVTADKASYTGNESAQIFIKSAFAGEALVTVMSDRLQRSELVSVGKEGARVSIPTDAAWGPGAYALVSVYRALGEKVQAPVPSRAVGLVWLARDTSSRTLAVALDSPGTVAPRQNIELPLQVRGVTAGQPAYLTLAAVDEGILQLTSFPSPKPEAHYWAKRRLGVEMRDDYRRLIDPANAERGALRTGGDGGAGGRGLPVVPIKSVALFSGIVQLDADGKARIPLALPDFNGKLRLMAVAWDQKAVGSGAGDVIVRDPLVADVNLPRFLAPADVARATLSLHNVAGGPGKYVATVGAKDAVKLAGESRIAVTLAAGERIGRAVALEGLEPGIGTVSLSVEGPGGFKVSREWQIAVRPAQALEHRLLSSQLTPNATLTVDSQLLNDFYPASASVGLSLSSRPSLDVTGLLKQLDKYPYGCLEQTVSRALPLLYFNDVSLLYGAGTQEPIRPRLDAAIRRVFDMQMPEGGFGLWSSRGDVEEWLSAFAMDFLGRARTLGFTVPAALYDQGLDRLRRQASTRGSDDIWQANARAYALYVLAREGVADVAALRYFHDNVLPKHHTALSEAQLGAALSFAGDTQRSNHALDLARRSIGGRWSRGDWYGSSIRDLAAYVVLWLEAKKPVDPILPLAERLARDAAERRWLSTQEQSWLLMAAHALGGQQKPLELKGNGIAVDVTKDPLNVTPTLDQVMRGFSIANAGQGPVFTKVSTQGVPKAPLPAASEGFNVVRTIHALDGKTADLAQVKQNDRLVVVLEGGVLTKLKHQALIVDLLPAGFEIEKSQLKGGGAEPGMKWLGDLTQAKHIEYRDDRFAAAADLGEGDREFRFAYMVRAITPGSFTLPATIIEDMYQPIYRARETTGKVTIAARD
jgi:uncharacterized protein YfaS (alpha-2-macroglobulin family)